MNLLKPLLCRPPMLPGETLNSYLCRLALANQHAPDMVMRLCQEHLGRYEALKRPDKTDVFATVAALTGLPPYKIYWSSPHGFTDLVVPRHVTTERVICAQGFDFPRIPEAYCFNHLRTNANTQFCPHCLAEAAFQRRVWQLKLVAACVQHQCLLVDHCPRCEQPIKTVDLVTMQCSHCQFHLVGSPTTSLVGDEAGLQAQGMLYYWMHAGPHVRLSLPLQPIRELYRLWYILRLAVFSVTESMKGLHRFPKTPRPFTWKLESQRTMAESYVATATAFQALSNWPDSFFDFLDRFRRRDGSIYSSRLRWTLGSLFENKKRHEWLLDEYRFVYDALVEYARRNWPAPVFKKYMFFENTYLPDSAFDWMLVKEAAVELGVTQRTLKRIMAGGLIHVKEDTELQCYKYLARRDVMALKESWRTAIPLGDAVVWLGVSEEVVVDMIRLGLLFSVRQPRVCGSAHWLISRDSIEELLADVHRQAAGFVEVEDRVDLKTAAQMLSPYGYTAAKIVEAVLAKSIRGCCTPRQVLDELVLSRKSIARRLKQSRELREQISKLQVANIMGVKSIAVDIWVKQGLLAPVAQTRQGIYFDALDVSRFKAEHVLTFGAARIAGVGALTIQKWARGGRLRPVSGPGVDERSVYLFRKDDLERLKQENRLTLPQLAKRWKVSRSQLHVWIRTGQVRPFSGPGIDGCCQYMFLKDEMEKASIPGSS